MAVGITVGKEDTKDWDDIQHIGPDAVARIDIEDTAEQGHLHQLCLHL